MSRTYRRKKGYRWFAEYQTDYDYVKGERLQYVVTNAEEVYNHSSWLKPKPEPIVRLRYAPTWYRIHKPKFIDYKLIANMERDKGNYTPTRSYKWDINKQRGMCEKTQLHKIEKSCRGDGIYNEDEMHVYDTSFENTHQRTAKWIYW